MRAHRTPVGLLGFFATIALGGACTVESGDAAADTDGAAAGKADGVDPAQFCPAHVALGSASGSARRCIDADSGRFVTTECCADVCEGAGWREQQNGTFCAWLATPGLPGAQVGQFAPTTCCTLGDDMACGRAEGERGDCADPETGRGVQDVCCEPTPQECHPAIRSSISGCLFDQIVEFVDDPEQLLPGMPELFDLCTHEGDLIAPEIDQRCNFQPELPFCGLDFGQVDAQFVAPCRDLLRDDFNCTFGRQFPDLFDQFHLSVVADRDFELADAQAADSVTQQQILIAARRGATDETDSLVEAFEFFDDNFINVVEIYDLSNNRGYTAYEFGAGDNGFGAIFDAGTTQVITDINDSFLEDPTEPFSEGCGVPMGAGGRPCGGETTCAAGFSCQGQIEHPVFGELGRCVDANLGAATAGESCTELRGCGDEAYCAGLSFGDGLCTPAWMFGRTQDDSFLELGDGQQGQTDLFVWGAATVPVDLELEFVVFHDTDVSQLTVTLVGPLRDEGTIATVFDGPNAGLPAGTRSRRLRMPAPHPGDEAINGQWSLVVEDAASGGGGGIFDASLTYSSRFD